MKRTTKRSLRPVSLLLAFLLAAVLGGGSASAAAMQGDYFVTGGPSFAYVITGIRADNGANTVKLYQDENMQSYSGYTGDYDLPATVQDPDGMTAYSVTELSGAVGESIPGALENLPAHRIGLPETLTTIGSRAFANSTVQILTDFPTSVTKVAADAFEGTSILQLDLLVNQPVTLTSSQAYTTASGKSVVLPTVVRDVTVKADLAISGNVTVSGDLTASGNVQVQPGATLAVEGTLKGSGGTISLENNATLVVYSALGADDAIYLKGTSAKVVNQSSNAIRVFNAKGERVTISAGEESQGELVDDPTLYPQILATNGGTVTVLERGKVIEITPNKGYTIGTVIINGYIMRGITRYEFATISAGNTVVVAFEKGKTEEGPQLPTKFIDVPTDAAYADAVNLLLEYGVCSGVSETQFVPNAKASRASVITMLNGLQNYGDDFVVKCEVTSVPYQDVPETAWYRAAVGWAVNTGICNRSENFGPNTAITREEFAVALYRYTRARGYAAYHEASRYRAYTDVAPLIYESRSALTWAATVGCLKAQGANSDQLNPAGTMTRAEVAQALATYLKLF